MVGDVLRARASRGVRGRRRSSLWCVWLIVFSISQMVVACDHLPDQILAATLLSTDADADVVDSIGTGIEDVGHDLPIIEIRVDPEQLIELRSNDDPEREIVVNVYLNGRRYAAAELELHGGYARELDKKSYRLHFDDDSHILFDFGEGAERFERLVLLASWIDPTFMRNKLTLDLAREVGMRSPRSTFAMVIFNDEPESLYAIVERVDESFLSSWGLNEDGNVYKAVSHNANWAAKSDPLLGFEQKINEDNPTDDLGVLLDVLSYTPTNYEAFVEGVEPVLDVEDFMRFQATNTYAMNTDTFTKNYYLYHDIEASPDELDDRFVIFPWDTDATWGIRWDGAICDEELVAWHGSDRFSPRLFSISTYKARYLDLMEEMLVTHSSEVLLTRVDAMALRIGDVARDDLSRWQPDVVFAERVGKLKAFIVERESTIRDLVRAERN